MRYISALTALAAAAIFWNIWHNESLAITHSETSTEHVSDKPDTSMGKNVYERACAFCHDEGTAGAIKLSDTATWQKHIHHGIDHMVESVIKGKGAMPARAGDPTLTDEEIKAAVNYIAEQTQ